MTSVEHFALVGGGFARAVCRGERMLVEEGSLDEVGTVFQDGKVRQVLVLEL